MLLIVAILSYIVSSYFEFAGYLAVMVLGIVFLAKTNDYALAISEKLKAIWMVGQIFLFVLIGAAVDVSLAINAGMYGIVIVVAGLLARSIVVYLSLPRSTLTQTEKLFVVISYLPKATVQAAIGSVPLAAGFAAGNLILALAVLSVVITAPVGAVGIRYFAPRWLNDPMEDRYFSPVNRKADRKTFGGLSEQRET